MYVVIKILIANQFVLTTVHIYMLAYNTACNNFKLWIQIWKIKLWSSLRKSIIIIIIIMIIIMKCGPLRWELKEKYKGYEVHQYNIIMDVLGGWSEETEISVQSLVGRKTTHVLERMQKAVLSATLNIARTFKVVI